MKQIVCSIALFLVSAIAFSQSNTTIVVKTKIVSPTEGETGVLNVCGETETFEVEISNITKSSTLQNVVFESTFLEGIELISIEGNYNNQGGGAGQPNIKIELPDIPANTVSTFRYQAKANCSLLTSVVLPDEAKEINIQNNNSISYNKVTSGNTESETLNNDSDSYNIVYTELETIVASKDTNIDFGIVEKDEDGTVFKRTVTVTNSGLGSTDKLTFYIDYDSTLTFNELTLNGVVLNPDDTSPKDSNYIRKTYTITDFSNIGNGNALLEQNEKLTFIDNVSLLYDKDKDNIPDEVCDKYQTFYSSYWGCNDTVCNKTDNDAISFSYISFVKGRSGFIIPVKTIKAGDFCGNQIEYEISVYNKGLDNVSLNDSNSALNIFFTDVRKAVRLPYVESIRYFIGNYEILDEGNDGANFERNFSIDDKLKIDPDGIGGLEDVDKDGYYDDLRGGSTLKIRVLLTLKASKEYLYDKLVGIGFTAIKLRNNNNECDPSYYNPMTYSYAESRWRNFYSEIPYEMVADSPEDDISPEPKEFKFYAYGVSYMIPKDVLNLGTFSSKFTLPTNYEIQSVKWINGKEETSLVPIKVKPGVYTVSGGGSVGHYFVKILAKCPSEDIASSPEVGKISWEMYLGKCLEEEEGFLYGKTSDVIFTDYTKCPLGGGGGCDFESTYFNIDRNTFGYTNPELTIKANKDTPGIALNRAYPLDEVLIEAEGKLRGKSPNGTVKKFNKLYFEIAFNQSGDGNPLLDPNSFEGKVNFGGELLSIKDFNLEVSNNNGRRTYLFSIDKTYTNEVEKTISLKEVTGQFINGSATNLGRGIYKLSVLRAKFYGQKEDGTNACSFSTGTNFDFYRAKNDFRAWGTQLYCSLDTYTSLIYFYPATLNHSIKDFPNEYRPIVKYNDYKIRPPKGYAISNTNRPRISGYPEGSVFLTLADDPNTTDYIEYSMQNIKPTVNRAVNRYWNQSISINFDPNCDNSDFIIPPWESKINMGYNLSYYDLLESKDSLIVYDSPNLDRYVYIDVPFSVNANTTQEGFKKQVQWPVEFCNENNSVNVSITGAWIALEIEDNDDSTILKGVKIGDKIYNEKNSKVVFYGEKKKNMFISIGNIDRDRCLKLYPIAEYTNCQNDVIQSINMISSWSCGNYPLNNLSEAQLASINSIEDVDLSCLYRVNKQTLELKYKTANIQWEVAEPEEDVDLCEPVSYDVKVTSSKYANMYNVGMDINLPTGVTFTGANATAALTYNYAGETGTFPLKHISNNTEGTEKVTVNISDFITEYLTANNPDILDGEQASIMPGTRAGTGKNEITLTFEVVAGCQYSPGRAVELNLKAETNCQDQIDLIFDNLVVPIKGIVLPDMDMTLNADNFLLCQDTNLVTITLENNTLDIAQQQLVVNLPDGVSFVKVVSNGGNTTPEPDEITGNKIKWNIDNLGSDVNQVYQVQTRLTNPALNTFNYSAETIQNGQATCITDGEECELVVVSSSDKKTVNKEQFPKIKIIPQAEGPYCEGTPIVLKVQMLNKFGQDISDYSPYNFTWNIPPSGGSNNSYTFSGITNTTTLTVTASLKGSTSNACKAQQSYTANLYPGAAVSLNLAEGITCSGETDATIKVKITGEQNTSFPNQAPFTITSYSHANVAVVSKTENINSGEEITITNVPYGQFAIAVTDSYGCTFTKQLNVPYVGNPISNLCTSRLPCDVSVGDVTMSFKASNLHTALENYTAVITNVKTADTIIPQFTGSFPDEQLHTLPNVSTAIPYQLTLTANNGCVYTKRFAIRSTKIETKVLNDDDPGFYELCYTNETRKIELEISNNITPCSNYKITSYNVQFGKINEDGTFIETPQYYNNVSSRLDLKTSGVGKYKAVVNATSISNYPDDQKACEEELYFEFKSRSTFTTTVKAKNPICYNEATGFAEAVINGGSGIFTYKWTDDSGKIVSTGQTASNLLAGTYKLVVYDDKGCPEPIPKEFTITNPDPLETPFIEDLQTSCSAIAGATENNTTAIGYTGGKAPYTFEWYGIKKYENLVTKLDDSSNVVIDAQGAIVYDTIIRKVYTQLKVERGIDEDSISVFDAIKPGLYKVVVTDANGCKVESEETKVTQPFVPRQYNLCFSWQSLPDTEIKTPEPKSSELTPIAASSFKQAIGTHVERCVNEAIGEVQGSVDYVLNDIDYLDDRLKLEYANGTSDTYHFTLYYYDRAGNLVRTVPPEGVVVAVDNNGNAERIPTSHTYVTGYDYNSLGQQQKQNTPDGGNQRHLYNDIGQLLYSQNDRQAEDNTFSYSIYDKLGRVIEGGEATLNGLNFPDSFVVNNQANPDIAKNLTTERKVEYMQTTFNKRAKTISYKGSKQRYLRNRVSYIYNLDKNGRSCRTYYSYDPHGNVEWLVQEAPGIGRTTVAYSYDLISGNVNQVVYNKGKVGEYHHKYTYDEDNRITSVKTSKNGLLWDEDARYDYYLHGPLARTELGEDNVQALDFTYTIHGWLKGINSPDLAQNAFNPDGQNTAGDNPTKHAQDEFGMALGYYEGDFTRPGALNSIIADNPFAIDNSVNGIRQDLYNGNISTWSSQIAEEARVNNKDSYLTGNSYQYDQLNRIKAATTQVYNPNTNTYGNVEGSANAFKTEYEFDANGNLTTLKRYKNDGQLMDDLEYYYDLSNPNLSNRLSHVKDAVGQVSAEINDLPNQSNNNYEYDAIGQLVRDNSEGLTYTWTNTGKVSQIIPDKAGSNDTQKVAMQFTYDGMGNRIEKVVNRAPYQGGNTVAIYNPEAVTVTYYTRDAQGNPLAVYKRTDKKLVDDTNDTTYQATFTVTEHPIYGSDRLGQDQLEQEVYQIAYSFTSETDYYEQSIQFIDELQKNAYGNVLLAQNNSTTVLDTIGAPVQIPSTQLSTSLVDRAFKAITYNKRLTQGEELLPVTTNNNLFIVENAEEVLQAYGVVVPHYYSTQARGTMLIYNTNNQLINGLNLINNDSKTPIDVKAKTVVVAHPTNASIHYLFYRDVNGGLHKATLQKGGDAISITATEKLNYSNYGRHLAVIENQQTQQAHIYATMHAGAVKDTLGTVTSPPQTSILRFTLNSGGVLQEEGTIIDAYESYDTHGDGELHIATDGLALSIYNYTNYPTQWTQAQDAEIRTWELDETTYLPYSNTPKIDPIEGLNIGKGTLANVATDIYYGQRTHYEENNSSRFVKRTSDNTVVSNQGLGDLRLNKNSKLYQFRGLANTGDEFDTENASKITLNNLPLSTVGTTGYQPYQNYTLLGDAASQSEGVVHRDIGHKRYELKDHLGNVRVVVNDRKDLDTETNTLTAHVEAYNNYYPYGMLQPNRHGNSGNYRYGYQGSEKDDEIKGEGNSYTTLFRQLDPRLGRWLSVDPLASKYPWQSPFISMDNSPILLIDVKGLSTDDWVEDKDGNVYWNEDVTSENDKDLKEGEIYRGTEYRRFENINTSTFDDVKYNSDKTISSENRQRPDIDGILTSNEAIDWYNYGGGEPLTVDVSKLNFNSSMLSIEDFGENNSKSVNFFKYFNIHAANDKVLWKPAKDKNLSHVFGTIRLAIVDKESGVIRVVTDDETGAIDTYDFRYFGFIANKKDGDPTEFLIFGNGTGVIRKESIKIEVKIPRGFKF